MKAAVAKVDSDSASRFATASRFLTGDNTPLLWARHVGYVERGMLSVPRNGVESTSLFAFPGPSYLPLASLGPRRNCTPTYAIQLG
jgi:hypothetical protein